MSMAESIGDIQGIQWSALAMTRDSYRATRLEKYPQFNTHENTFMPFQEEPHQSSPTDSYMRFERNIRRAAPTILHFQLRHLVSAVSNHVVLTMNSNCIYRCDTLANTVEPILDLTGFGRLDHVPISTIHNEGRLLFAGGFHGELIVQNMESGAILYNKHLTTAENSISNSITTRSGMVICANNDNFVEVLDLPTLERLSRVDADWAVNHCTTSYDGRLMCMVGDSVIGYVIDMRSWQRVATLEGHLDFSFASSWHPNGMTIATGNQDRTCRIWDMRNTSSNVKVIEAQLAAVRSVRFSDSGGALVVGEAADFVQVYDCANDLATCQRIDFFGEMAGFDMSTNGTVLFIGVSDHVYGGMLQFARKPMGFLSSYLL